MAGIRPYNLMLQKRFIVSQRWALVKIFSWNFAKTGAWGMFRPKTEDQRLKTLGKQADENYKKCYVGYAGYDGYACYRKRALLS